MTKRTSLLVLCAALGCVSGTDSTASSPHVGDGKTDESETAGGAPTTTHITAHEVSFFTTAYPFSYTALARTRFYENAEPLHVFDVSGVDGEGHRWTRRIESYFTGGDWMEYGVIYFIVNDRGAEVYEIAPLSTTDKEGGETAPAVTYSEATASELITTELLDGDGHVTASFPEDAAVKEAISELVR